MISFPWLVYWAIWVAHVILDHMLPPFNQHPHLEIHHSTPIELTAPIINKNNKTSQCSQWVWEGIHQFDMRYIASGVIANLQA